MHNIRIENQTEKSICAFAGEHLLFEYCYRPETQRYHCPRPYFHPICMLGGDVVTNHRPADHPWHQGLSLTLTDVSDRNFWGGPTYRGDSKTYEAMDNVGHQIHLDWLEQETGTDSARLVETLEWRGPSEELVFNETRALTIEEVDIPGKSWRLGLRSELVNATSHPLTLHSYASRHGLIGSGYSGWFLRLSRGFSTVPRYIFPKGALPAMEDAFTPEGPWKLDEVNGLCSRKLGLQGIFDTSLNGGLLLFEDRSPENAFPHHFFYRAGLPCLAFSPTFREPVEIPVGGKFVLDHTITFRTGFPAFDDARNF